MAGAVNKVILVGNLGADPEVRSMPSGGKVVNLRIATSESWRDRSSGERREKTEWHRVVIFSEGLAKVAEQYLKKGSKVYLEGSLQTRKWTDQAGQDRYQTEVVLQNFNSSMVLLDRREGGAGGGFGGGGDDYGDSFGGGGYSSGGGGGGGGGGRSGGGDFGSRSSGSGGASRPSPAFDSDLDDDVPF